MAFDAQDLSGWIGRKAIDAAGEKVGSIADVYADDATGEAEWLAITTGWFGSHISFVPLGEAKPKGDEIEIGYDKDKVKDAPHIDVDGNMSVEEEEQLYRYYGLTYAPQLSSSEGGAEALQDTGSTTVNAEISPEVAVARLRRRDAEDLADIGFEDDEK